MKQLWFGLLILCAAPLTAQQMDPNMPGMQHGAPAQMPGDMHHPSPANKPAQRETQSERDSEAQQEAQPLQAAPAQSIARDVLHLQEQENLAARTGGDLPAPELLTDVATRAPITLGQWQQWAESKNPTLMQAHALQERSQQQGRQAAMLPNPTIGYSGDHIRGGSYGGGEQGAFVQQTIVTGGKLGLRRDVYTQQAAADGIGVEEQTYRVRGDVGRAFYRALAAQAVVAARQRLVKVAGDAVETSHHMANLGQVDSPDVLQAEVEAEQAKIDYVDAQREYLQRFRVLAALAGQPELPISPLAGDLEQVPNLNADDAVSKALAESPSVKRAQQQANVAAAEVKATKREPIPNLTVQAGEWYSGEKLDGTNKQAGWMSFAQAGVEVPLWNRNQGATAAASADVARAQAEITRTQLQLRQTAEPLAQQYLAARFQAERYRDQLLPRAQRAYELYNMKYQQMAAAYPQVLVSQRTLFQLQISYLHALEQEWVSAVGLENYTLRGGLNKPTQGEENE
jgi:cobalt-zinc-cadmium efflux system outer membrane protein